MKLLFDQNLSPQLCEKLKDLFPGSSHVHLCGLGGAKDLEIWEFAKNEGFNIVSKDADYGELSTTLGDPPKVIWVRRGNCTTAQMEELIRADVDFIRQLESNPELRVISLL